MPDFLPEEADHCPYCGEVLRNPPVCCDTMVQEFELEEKAWLDKINSEDYDPNKELSEVDKELLNELYTEFKQGLAEGPGK